MACFYYFKEKCRDKGQRKSAPTPTTYAAVASPTSNNGPSRSAEAATSATKLISKSAGAESSPRSIPVLYEERAQNLRVFDIKELINATNNFSRLLKIGEGGFGSVYKGILKPVDQKDNITVAIKKLNPEGLQGHKQWMAEVQFLGVVEHPNLVKLVGYCAVDGERGPQRLLVYEFIPNKTLDDHLFNRAYHPLPWILRLQIALGAAEGLAYLHEGLEVQVIYRDFKASNVLLNEEFKPKLSDFGLAREGPSEGHTHVSTAVMGTYGYAAPDYVESGHLTAKSDVWSFGVVLYEILTGRRSTERNRPRNEQKLLDWVKQFPLESSRFSLIIDPRLENKYSMNGAREIAKLANLCLAKHGRERPSMREVVEFLKQALEYKDLNGQDGPVEELSPAPRETDDKYEKESGLTSAKRRMLHLAKMGESQNAFGKRKFMLMRAANQV